MRKGSKQFFFEKKNQKTFVHWLRPFRRGSAQDSRVFCFFFSKKKPFLLALPISLSACAVGPDFHKPTTDANIGYGDSKLTAHDASQKFVKDLDIPGQWWALFHSPQVNTLVEHALAANPGLQGAQAALRQARESVYAQEGAFFPDISATFEPTRNKTATRSVSYAASQPTAYYTLVTAQLAVSYSPDIWGGTRREVESLVAQAEQQRYQLEATYLTLTSNLVAAAINEASLRAQIAATRQIIAAETDLLGVFQRQYAAGQVAQVDVLAQQAALAQAQATLPPLQKQFDQQRDALAALTGATPGEVLPESFTLDQLHLPEQLPVTLPASLVDQRPDVLAAKEALHAACAQVGVAIANRLPSLTLSAVGGSQSNYFRQLFASGNGFWTLAASLTQPVFDGGALLHKARGAWAALDQAESQYRSTTLAAFQNVADSLAALQADADAVAAATTAARAAEDTLRIVHLQVSLGQAAYLTILNATQTALQAELTLIQARANRLADTAALFQALGGGWWHRTDSQVRDIKGNDIGRIVGIR
jgi:NodT family efflux transporter outer membrane factor (OMF) lipoprotein